MATTAYAIIRRRRAPVRSFILVGGTGFRRRRSVARKQTGDLAPLLFSPSCLSGVQRQLSHSAALGCARGTDRFAVRALHALALHARALHALRATGDGRGATGDRLIVHPRVGSLVSVSPLSLDTFVTSDKDVEDERSLPCGALRRRRSPRLTRDSAPSVALSRFSSVKYHRPCQVGGPQSSAPSPSSGYRLRVLGAQRRCGEICALSR